MNNSFAQIDALTRSKKASLANALLMYKMSAEREVATPESGAATIGADVYKGGPESMSIDNILAANDAANVADFNAGNSLPTDHSFMNTLRHSGSALGLGAAGGAAAGLPIGLLAHAIFGKDKGLRGYLRSALLGTLIGGGAGALGGGALRYMTDRNPGLRSSLLGQLEGLKSKEHTPAPMALRAMTGDPFKYEQLDPATKAKFQAGEIGIPGVSREYFGMSDVPSDKKTILNKLLQMGKEAI